MEAEIVVNLIEDQIHNFLIVEEAERCRRIEEENRRDPNKPNAKAKPREVHKPWSRGSFPRLCQETDLLPMVSEYDYDLEDQGFQNYCVSRGVLHVAGNPGSERWGIFLDFGFSRADYLENPYFQFTEGVSGAQHQYTPEQMETQWKIILIGRAKLQDCWELFRQRGEE